MQTTKHESKDRLNRDYAALKDEVKEAEQIRRSVYDIMRSDQRQPRRAHDMDR